MVQRVVTVNDVLDGHVALDIECLDRIYLNAYVLVLQTSSQVVAFLSGHLGFPFPSPVLFRQLGEQPLTVTASPAGPGVQLHIGTGHSNAIRVVPDGHGAHIAGDPAAVITPARREPAGGHLCGCTWGGRGIQMDRPGASCPLRAAPPPAVLPGEALE
jgi:hypothetical protein